MFTLAGLEAPPSDCAHQPLQFRRPQLWACHTNRPIHVMFRCRMQTCGFCKHAGPSPAPLLASARDEQQPWRLGVVVEFQQYQEDVSSLMKLVAPHLRPLLLSDHDGQGEDELVFPDIGWLRYPELRELSLYGHAAKFGIPTSTTEGPGGDLANCPPLPNLSRLHITCATQSYHYSPSSNATMRQRAECAPDLTHLCLSNWKMYHPYVIPTIADVVGQYDTLTPNARAELQSYRSLLLCALVLLCRTSSKGMCFQ